ncbi:MAG: hypothetical protein JJU45_00200 [Acidimicrobiia bacterium]|nr:hypothetical protein [Acidimicrobiia bacterium]
MLDLLFGPQRSVARRLCVVTAGVMVLLGLTVAVTSKVAEGIAIVALGVVATAVLARDAEVRTARAASSEVLGRLPESDPEALREWVDRSRHEPGGPLGHITGEISSEDLAQAAREARQDAVRLEGGESTSGPTN